MTTTAADRFYEGTRLLSTRDLSGAEAALREALALQPDLAEAHANLALALEHQGHMAEAEPHYRRALELQPWQTQTLRNFGAMLHKQKRLIEAEIQYRMALAIRTDEPGTYTNLGALLACMKREAEAEQCYRTGMQISPDYRGLRFNLAYILIRQGRWEEGFACLQGSDWVANTAKRLSFAQWHGEPLQGRSIFVSYEAGHGDMLQFCRYIPLLKSQHGAARVTVMCHPGLLRLFKCLPGVDELIPIQIDPPTGTWDYWIVPMMFPYLFGTRPDVVQGEYPYLHADTVDVQRWASIIGDQPGLKIGLVWRGNANFENDADRSIYDTSVFAPLAAIPGVRWFSLQLWQGQPHAGQDLPPLPLTDLATQFRDFGDTAAAVANLDLVISIDSAVAHLVGALGKPCWLLLADYKTDGRWLKDIDTTPWYPGVMRLFRQAPGGNWADVMDAVAAALTHRS
ncbi:MAG TPA: tetratricopeptide repeat protein [Rhodocyclaceae bacterium]|nr:tetratricopeptide repeat protein [Rhodocyclaceae bacterium]